MVPKVPDEDFATQIVYDTAHGINFREWPIVLHSLRPVSSMSDVISTDTTAYGAYQDILTWVAAHVSTA